MAVSVLEYEKALLSLVEAIEFYNRVSQLNEKKIARDASIQRFEFCVELAWKTAGRLMGSDSTAANMVVREMARNHFIEDPEAWLNFIKARNLSSHTYDENMAKNVFDTLVQFCSVWAKTSRDFQIEMKFGLEDRHWHTVDVLVIQPLKENDCRVWVFGSRATGMHKKFSDLDILYKPSERSLPNGLLTQITENVENSSLPIKVDIVAEADLAESYRDGILKTRVEI